ncbi:MAG: radical SAM protein [Gemmatimonadota bacterium]|nr:MAG: radical SAM protein [Gemmatimonadota bacterium]
MFSKTRGFRSKENDRIAVALVYPNTYEVGMANLGFQAIFRLLNSFGSVVCERVFLPQGERPVTSTESGRTLTECDIIAFSFSFELDYVNAVQMLMHSGISLRSEDRDERTPLIMAGGVSVTLNPEPMASIIDLFVIGESEEVLGTLLNSYMRHRRQCASRHEILVSLARLPGIYVPRCYQLHYNPDGTIAKIEPLQGAPARVRRQHVQEIGTVHAFSQAVSPRSHFKDMFLVEVGRGCPRGCSFCASGYIYRPFRCRSKEALLSLIENNDSGAKKVGLVGSAISDHRDFEELCVELVDRGYQLGVSSFRADALTPRLVEAFVRGGIRTLTMAPETGSEKLRFRIHKRLTDDHIFKATHRASAGGIINLKLYFLIGIPFEEESDVAAIVSLVKRTHRVFFQQRGKKGTITVSVHPFVPKASTPFQWSPMQPVKPLKEKLNILEAGLRGIRGVRFSPKSPRNALLQGMFSVGDRRIGEALRAKVQGGVLWKRAWEQAKVEPEFFLHREKTFEEVLPWDVLDSGIEKRVLWNQYKKARDSG